MKDIKLKERLEKAFEAFFESAETDSTYLEKMSDHKIAKEPAQKIKVKNIFKILRQICLFFPATFFTFYLWMGVMIFGLPSVEVPLFFLILVSAQIMMVLGMGNVKNLKHWIMPLSVIILGSVIGITMTSIPMLRDFIESFENAILLFPLALITAVLSKNWVDSPEKT